MDTFDNITPIVGSRRPIVVPAFSDDSASSSHLASPPSAFISTPPSASSSRSRRKPKYVFKSPSADDPGEWETHTTMRKRATPPYERRRTSTSTDTSRSSAQKYILSVKTAVQRHAPLLPLYHPLGPLAQSLPKLDPGQFGLPSSLSVDDGDDQAEGDSNAGTSRSRRAGPKGREDDPQTNGTPNGIEKAAQDAPARDRNASPRKRRGGGGGAKRKRKDTEDGDGVFPPPAKRTRNPRGAAATAPAAPSPLVVSAVVASDLADEPAPEKNEPEEAQEEPTEAQTPKRSARTRKPRATRPAKRRDSSGSGSTSTSVSVSIAAATKAAASSKCSVPADDERRAEAEPVLAAEPNTDAQKPLPNGADKHEEEETEEPLRHPATAPVPADKDTPSAEQLPASTADALPPDPLQDTGKDVTVNGITPTPSARTPSPAPVPAPLSPPALPAHIDPPPQKESPQREEREEGELTD
ncbi:hypothetical protein DICSQDRAFT_182697 [Dichomitus squalens LYAD-421 SS1]|uniref:Uncharacterized protein n=1 Tax=Dichomitus squalens (strain LYAD-421) TaxID=732165 RepID=R7SQ78_DICSQ|nr:uncharacterized protein DICSQDRAFT_182697 [Dichomitus squalens LYAD-421 SS1]EJF58216.1 hypothetical protein DICSQDRAFT_182697 [Dichomitus squalens LYAD-421 SS1]